MMSLKYPNIDCVDLGSLRVVHSALHLGQYLLQQSVSLLQVLGADVRVVDGNSTSTRKPPSLSIADPLSFIPT